MKKRLPPYSKRLASNEGRSWGSSPDRTHYAYWLLFGSIAWGKAKEWHDSRRLFVLLPPESDPCVYDWRFLAGHPPVLLLPCGAVSGAEVKALIVALLRDGVERALYLGVSGMTLFAPVKGMRHVE